MTKEKPIKMRDIFIQFNKLGKKPTVVSLKIKENQQGVVECGDNHKIDLKTGLIFEDKQ